jgi:hypothetical protein
MPAVGCLVVLVVLLLELVCRCYRWQLIRQPGLQKRVIGQKLHLRWRLCHAVYDGGGSTSSSGGDGGGSWQAAGNCDDLKTGSMVKNQACF